jgi:type III pantothenate kinase
MVMTIDAGNTTVSWVVFDRGQVVERGACATESWVVPAAFLSLKDPDRIHGIYVASVVPRLDQHLAAACREVFGRIPVFLDHHSARGLSFAVDDPTELGADRIAACMGALTLFAPPLIIVDSGTATTYDLVDASRVYIGGAIAPGVRLLLKSLAQNTAKLREVDFAVPRSDVAKNTRDHIQFGVYHQFIGGMEHTIGHFRHIMGPDVRVIGCGGTLGHLPVLPKGIDHYEADLIHTGLRYLADGES